MRYWRPGYGHGQFSSADVELLIRMLLPKPIRTIRLCEDFVYLDEGSLTPERGAMLRPSRRDVWVFIMTWIAVG